ncbi:low molecular weight protein-tyrosine-phosphatase [Bacillus sinesaloumensis]|uniref:low molecular weight protein-tyrosine-phosphatase n=1 Tax=Litchfieldia sinesaloumensis TaxID=1926280 RepID=UPI000988694A|nr:low molecular weight protein-tyrosine-phosphatase [Bacillus sinesaloumensis]
MIKVLFVCLGNICRSPMAEAIFRDLVKKEGLVDQIEVDSAGTGDWHIGRPPHEGTQKILTKNNISFEGMKARQVIANDLENFDYIIAMDSSNVGNLNKIFMNEKTGKVQRLLDLVDGSKILDVPDPYYTGNFDEVYELVSNGCQRLLDVIKKENLLVKGEI